MRARRERAALRRREREMRLATAAGDGSLAALRYANAPTASVNLSLLTFDAPPDSPVFVAPASLSRGGSPNAASNVSAVATVRRAGMPFDFNVPSNWSPAKRARQGEAVYTVLAPDGRATGTAVLAPVSLSPTQVAAAPTTVKTKSVGGVPVTALRRTVIDRMVAEGGWVTNDIVQESHGRRVFVVLAQTGTPGMPARSWTFYFTEIDGRVYSLATTAPVEFAAPLAAGSEQLMATLKSAGSKNVASER